MCNEKKRCIEEHTSSSCHIGGVQDSVGGRRWKNDLKLKISKSNNFQHGHVNDGSDFERT